MDGVTTSFFPPLLKDPSLRHAARPMILFLSHIRETACRPVLILSLLTLALGGGIQPALAQTQATPSSTTPTAPEAAPAFAGGMTRDVLVAALGFLAPRTLDAHSAREFCIWGLDGLTAIDPTIIVTTNPAEDRDGQHIPETVTITRGQKAFFKHPLPADTSRTGWADLVTAAMDAAWSHSSTIRDAGDDALLQGFFDELFNHMDPYSRYLGPTPAVADRTRRTGQSGTVGLTLGQKGHSIVVTAVNANGPAWEAGVDMGQRLVSVNGKSTHGQSPDTVQSWLDGDERTAVSLALASKGKRPATLKLMRAQVPPETVFASTVDAYTLLRISSFSTQTAEEISQYLDQVVEDDTPDGPGATQAAGKAKRPAGIIIDLRGDRGGVLQQAVTAAALFLDHGVAVTTHGRDPQANHIWAVQGGDMTSGAPIVILVDGRTASAAEILAAALADHRRAVVIGSETLGKGLVQVIGQMPNGGELFVTWSRNQAPLGWPIQGLGVMPQVCTSRGSDDLHAQLDALKNGNAPQAGAVQMARAARYPVPVARILDIRRHCPAAIGTDADMDTARFMLSSASAYKAALEAVPDENTAPLH
ncbi:peptidase S41 [Gluconobacter cerinus]|nr:peptidase S41 [Gluconobacter cerinus]MBS1048348.1 peptidase S41 [Gluconobacter cerinus]